MYDASGEELGLCVGALNTGATCQWISWVKLGGRTLAGYSYGYGAWFEHPTALGSTATQTDYARGLDVDMTFYPWGQIWNQAGPIHGDIRFAGFQYPEWQFGPLLYPTNTRKYNPSLARWLSPDAMAGDVTNPQSLNRYAYVGNNPMSFTDPSGLGPKDGTDPCGNRPNKAACGGDAASSAAACMEAGLTPNCGGPLGSGELAAAEANYNLMTAQAFLAGCSNCGQSQTINGMTFSWVPTQTNDPSTSDDPIADYTMSQTTGHWEQTTYTYFPDFTQFQISLGALVGVTFQVTVDKSYHVYMGGGLNAGKSLQPVSLSITPGYMLGGRAAVSPAYLKDFLTKWGCSAGLGFGLGGFFNWSGGGQAISGGFSTAQAGISCVYSGQLW